MAMRGFDLPATIPLFALPGAVLMPRASLPLHLFEPRYLQMLDDTLKTPDRLIGMIQPMGDGLARIGCAGRVVMFSETGDGRMDIVLRAVSRFSLGGVEKVVEIKLDKAERAMFDKSVDSVKGLVEACKGIDSTLA